MDGGLLGRLHNPDLRRLLNHKGDILLGGDDGSHGPKAEEAELEVLDAKGDTDDGEEHRDAEGNLSEEEDDAERQPQEVPARLRTCADVLLPLEHLAEGEERKACDLFLGRRGSRRFRQDVFNMHSRGTHAMCVCVCVTVMRVCVCVCITVCHCVCVCVCDCDVCVCVCARDRDRVIMWKGGVRQHVWREQAIIGLHCSGRVSADLEAVETARDAYEGDAEEASAQPPKEPLEMKYRGAARGVSMLQQGRGCSR